MNSTSTQVRTFRATHIGTKIPLLLHQKRSSAGPDSLPYTGFGNVLLQNWLPLLRKFSTCH